MRHYGTKTVRKSFPWGASQSYRTQHANSDDCRNKSEVIVGSGCKCNLIVNVVKPFASGGPWKFCSFSRHVDWTAAQSIRPIFVLASTLEQSTAHCSVRLSQRIPFDQLRPTASSQAVFRRLSAVGYGRGALVAAADALSYPACAAAQNFADHNDLQ